MARDTLAPTVSIGTAVSTDTLPGEPCSTVGSKRFKSSRPDQIKTRDSISCRGFFIFRLRIGARSILFLSSVVLGALRAAILLHGGVPVTGGSNLPVPNL